ncbi:hypothetical protein ADIS_3675 [Lunatimonas lonarensis]|uniref:Uncharacterized protein n=1 Tax=Lunatimonas lonarensis TaxID=1232681 RepID=R7ZP34_9BACT|nr:hypothetical protein ADIS_3675 [Lunatimonas lonarensis]
MLCLNWIYSITRQLFLPNILLTVKDWHRDTFFIVAILKIVF